MAAVLLSEVEFAATEAAEPTLLRMSWKMAARAVLSVDELLAEYAETVPPASAIVFSWDGSVPYGNAKPTTYVSTPIALSSADAAAASARALVELVIGTPSLLVDGRPSVSRMTKFFPQDSGNG